MFAGDGWSANMDLGTEVDCSLHLFVIKSKTKPHLNDILHDASDKM